MQTGLITLTLKTPSSDLEQIAYEKEKNIKGRTVQVSTNIVFYKISDYDHTMIITGNKNGVCVKETPEEILLLIREANHLEKLVRDK